MVSTVDFWTPPAGMAAKDVTAWRGFYRAMLAGNAGYTLTPAEYRLLYIGQKGRCWICRTAKGIHPDDPRAAGTRRLGVDHNHLTREVRGLLCTGGDKTCNRVIGWLGQQALARAAQYLADPPARVLAVAARVAEDLTALGSAPTQADLDTLAVNYLWDGES
jgi:hypothetical protein